MELLDNIESLKTFSQKLAKEIEIEDSEVKEYLVVGRKRMFALDEKKNRLYHIEAAINNIQALLDEEKDKERAAADPWA